MPPQQQHCNLPIITATNVKAAAQYNQEDLHTGYNREDYEELAETDAVAAKNIIGCDHEDNTITTASVGTSSNIASKYSIGEMSRRG